MIRHTYPDKYGPEGSTVSEYGIVIDLGHRSYGRDPSGNVLHDDKGRDGVDTVTAVMFGDGKPRVFDVDQVEEVTPTPKTPPAKS